MFKTCGLAMTHYENGAVTSIYVYYWFNCQTVTETVSRSGKHQMFGVLPKLDVVLPVKKGPTF